MRCKKYLFKLTFSKVSAYKQLSNNANIHSYVYGNIKDLLPGRSAGLMDFKFLDTKI